MGWTPSMGARIAVGGLWHETNTFAAGRTEVADFGIVEGPAIIGTLGGMRTPLGGYLDAAQRAGVEVVPTFFAFALPSGLVSRDALDSIVGRLVALVSEARPDAILLDLHGAMAAEGSDDVEGALLGDLRARLGRVPIGVVFDFHANTTATFVERVDVFAGYDTYPHLDPYDRGVEVFGLLRRQMAGEIHPTRAYAQPPLLLAPQVQATAR